MKILLFVFITVLSHASFANVIVKDQAARSIMEALVASGYKLVGIDGEWSGQTLKVTTEALSCSYSAMFPDEMMSNIRCSAGAVVNTPYLNESLALAKSLVKFAPFEPAAGSRYLSLNSINCSLVYDSKKYECNIALEN